MLDQTGPRLPGSGQLLALSWGPGGTQRHGWAGDHEAVPRVAGAGRGAGSRLAGVGGLVQGHIVRGACPGQTQG